MENWIGPCWKTYRSRLLVDQVEDGVEGRVPQEAVADALPPQLPRHNLQQVHLDGLLNEHNIVLGHRCKSFRRYYTFSLHKRKL